MRYVRLLLTSFVFCLAASGSIWIGWIYAGAHPRDETFDPAAGRAAAPFSRPSASGDGGSPQDFNALPDLGSVNVIPGADALRGQTSELNGFPTISKEAIERAAGFTDRALPEIDLPFKFGIGSEPVDSDFGGVTPP